MRPDRGQPTQRQGGPAVGPSRRQARPAVRNVSRSVTVLARLCIHDYVVAARTGVRGRNGSAPTGAGDAHQYLSHQSRPYQRFSGGAVRRGGAGLGTAGRGGRRAGEPGSGSAPRPGYALAPGRPLCRCPERSCGLGNLAVLPQRLRGGDRAGTERVRGLHHSAGVSARDARGGRGSLAGGPHPPAAGTPPGHRRRRKRRVRRGSR